MSLLFDRVIRFQFGKRGESPVVIEDLYMQFEVEKSSESEPNKCSIQVHNLSLESISKLERKQNYGLLEVGYRGDSGKSPKLKQLFIGQIKTAPTEKQNHETVTKVELYDGIEQYSEANVNLTLAPGATTRQVLTVLATQFGTGIGAIKGVEDKSYQQGVTLAGPVRDRLDELTRKMGLEWSIQNNKLQILPPKVPSETIGFLLSPDTGLLGSPTSREEAKSGGKFIEFHCLMNAGIYPGVAVEIESERFNGIFKVRKVRYEGDNRIGPFQMKCEAQEISSGPVIPSLSLPSPPDVLGGWIG